MTSFTYKTIDTDIELTLKPDGTLRLGVTTDETHHSWDLRGASVWLWDSLVDSLVSSKDEWDNLRCDGFKYPYGGYMRRYFEAVAASEERRNLKEHLSEDKT